MVTPNPERLKARQERRELTEERWQNRGKPSFYDKKGNFVMNSSLLADDKGTARKLGVAAFSALFVIWTNVESSKAKKEIVQIEKTMTSTTSATEIKDLNARLAIAKEHEGAGTVSLVLFVPLLLYSLVSGIRNLVSGEKKAPSPSPAV